ncbi:zinc finger protein 91-like [Pecten maximus]|uniref:zinc finger protein 91-like n=1 Tax=Pecten maximus TaxID=6579 RepID=UPI001457FB22|nr:zinc finger protein 91-like [Pecten maximus]
MDEDGREKEIVRLPASSNSRPHKCEVCSRQFREIATLRKHEQLHRADRPYVCTTCGKSFLWSSNLKVHERVHTGERPYKCKICHRCFTQSNDLRRHERNVHMRGKLVNYRSTGARAASSSGQVNMAAYQAFAMQQRALLQHALTYETIMHSAAAVTQSHYMGPPSDSSILPAPKRDQCDLAVSTSTDSMYRSHKTPSPIKLEQVTPPSTPGDEVHQSDGQNSRPLSNQNSSDSELRNLQRQMSNEYGKISLTTSSSVIHSPPALSSSTYLSQRSHTSDGASPHKNGLVSPHSHCPSISGMTTLPQPVPLPPISSIYGVQTSTSDRADRVIDLSMNKSISSGDSDDGDWKGGNSSFVSKSPQMSETESEEKRDVTTTSETPTVDSGIHHCPHCNLFFQDFTMFHLHQSLHPLDHDPFRCPSCQKCCQDRIEFMFHIVWHVKYPHTIPNYQPFKESYLT